MTSQNPCLGKSSLCDYNKVVLYLEQEPLRVLVFEEVFVICYRW